MQAKILKENFEIEEYEKVRTISAPDIIRDQTKDMNTSYEN